MPVLGRHTVPADMLICGIVSDQQCTDMETMVPSRLSPSTNDSGEGSCSTSRGVPLKQRRTKAASSLGAL
jgi:hypothetical protein